MKHAGTERIDTERLILRELKVEDARNMYENWANDCEVTRYLSWLPHENIAETESLLTMWTKSYEKPCHYQWGIVFREVGEVCGSISVVRSEDENRMMEIGYCIGKAFWGKGITTEALKAVISYLFTSTDVNRIQGYCLTENQDSGKVMKKCGMQYEGRMRQAVADNRGVLSSVDYFAILRSDI